MSKKEESVFKDSVRKALKHQRENKLPEDKKLKSLIDKANHYIDIITKNKDRILFYCPDITFPTELTKFIYELVSILRKDGKSAFVLHEYKGFKPSWLNKELISSVKVEYMSENKKERTPSFRFSPTDTIVVPDGFSSIMAQLSEIKLIQKVVLVMGHYGLGTLNFYDSWAKMGFHDAIYISDELKETNEILNPDVNHYRINYTVDTLDAKPVDRLSKILSVGIYIRNREEAQQIINIFYKLYPYYNFIGFKVIKKLSQKEYYDAISKVIVVLMSDEHSGFPILPLEAMKLKTPVMSVVGRGQLEFTQFKNFYDISTNDPFVIASKLKEYIDTYLKLRKSFMNDDKFDKYISRFTHEKTSGDTISVFGSLIEEKNKIFVALREKYEKELTKINNKK